MIALLILAAAPPAAPCIYTCDREIIFRASGADCSKFHDHECAWSKHCIDVCSGEPVMWRMDEPSCKVEEHPDGTVVIHAENAVCEWRKTSPYVHEFFGSGLRP